MSAIVYYRHEHEMIVKGFELLLQLQYQSTSVNTKDLTKSFGWGTYDAFLQHDIQEMEAILCEKLEEKMKVCNFCASCDSVIKV